MIYHSCDKIILHIALYNVMLPNGLTEFEWKCGVFVEKQYAKLSLTLKCYLKTNTYMN